MIVKFFADLRDITKTKEVEIKAPATIMELLTELSLLYGKKLQSRIIGEGNKLHPDMIVLINGRHIEHLFGEASKLADADVVSFFPRIAGG